jgi:hypothetical protein
MSTSAASCTSKDKAAASYMAKLKSHLRWAFKCRQAGGRQRPHHSTAPCGLSWMVDLALTLADWPCLVIRWRLFLCLKTNTYWLMSAIAHLLVLLHGDRGGSTIEPTMRWSQNFSHLLINNFETFHITFYNFAFFYLVFRQFASTKIVCMLPPKAIYSPVTMYHLLHPLASWPRRQLRPIQCIYYLSFHVSYCRNALLGSLFMTGDSYYLSFHVSYYHRAYQDCHFSLRWSIFYVSYCCPPVIRVVILY